MIGPDHSVEAGFLCYDNAVIMRTFRRGQEQAERLLRSGSFQRFLESVATCELTIDLQGQSRE